MPASCRDSPSSLLGLHFAKGGSLEYMTKRSGPHTRPLCIFLSLMFALIYEVFLISTLLNLGRV